MKACIVLFLAAATGFGSVAMAAVERDPIWPSGVNPGTNEPLNGFCDCQQALLDNTMLSLLPAELSGLPLYLNPGTGDINGESYVVRSPFSLSLNGNGMLDCSIELKLIEEVLRDTLFNMNGLTHAEVLTAWNDNDCQLARDVGGYWGLVDPLLNGLAQVLKGHMIIGDGSATFSDPVGSPPEFNRVDCTGSTGLIQGLVFLLGFAAANSQISLESKETTLAGALAADSTSASSTVTLAAPLNLAAGDYIRVGHEYMWVRSASNTRTVIVNKRGAPGSNNPAMAHEVGEQVFTGYHRMPEKFSRFGDADGDGVNNDCEYSVYGAALYVESALNPAIRPTDCEPPEMEFGNVRGSGWYEEDNPVHLEVSVVRASGNVSYQWFKDGVSIQDAIQRVYDIEHVKLADAGSYTCQARDGGKGGKTVIETGPILVRVFGRGSLPVGGIAGLGSALFGVVGAGIWRLRRVGSV